MTARFSSFIGIFVIISIFAALSSAQGGVVEYAYVANSNSNNVSAYIINRSTGALTEMSGSPFPTGAEPVSVAVHPSARFVYVANNGIADPPSVSAYSIDRSTGALIEIVGSPFPNPGLSPAASSIAVDPSGKFLYVANASSENIAAYTINPSNGALTAVSGSPFPVPLYYACPLAIDPSGKFLYVTQCLSGNQQYVIAAYTIDSTTGALTAIRGSPFPEGSYTGPHAVAVDPSGKFVYVANAFGVGPNPPSSISAYIIDSATGALSAVAGSPFLTRTFAGGLAVDPSGKFVYVGNAGSNQPNQPTVSAYSIDTSTGALTPVSGSPFPNTGAPNGFPAVAVDPFGKFVYVTGGFNPGNVSAYAIDSSTGALTTVSGSPFPAQDYPIAVGIAGVARANPHDFNGHGMSDIAWRNTGGDTATWLMNGTTVLSSGVLGLVPTTWSIVGQRDFDGDGKADLLWRDTMATPQSGS